MPQQLEECKYCGIFHLMKPPASPSPPPFPHEILERDSAPSTAPDLPIVGVEIDLSGMEVDEPQETSPAVNVHLKSACAQLLEPDDDNGSRDTPFTHLNPEAFHSNLNRLLDQLRGCHPLHALPLLRQEAALLDRKIIALEEERRSITASIELCEGDLDQWRREIIAEAEKRVESGSGTKLVAAHKRVQDSHKALASMGRVRRTIAIMHKACINDASRILGKHAAEYGAVVDFEPDPWVVQFVPGLKGDIRKQELERRKAQLETIDRHLQPLQAKLAMLQAFFRRILERNLTPLPPHRPL